MPRFMRLAREYENCYGDTAALNLPDALVRVADVLNDPVVRGKLVHGSDWPIPAFPPVSQLGWGGFLPLFWDSNWMRRDVRIKQRLGLGPDYWHRRRRCFGCPQQQPNSSGRSRTSSHGVAVERAGAAVADPDRSMPAALGGFNVVSGHPPPSMPQISGDR